MLFCYQERSQLKPLLHTPHSATTTAVSHRGLASTYGPACHWRFSADYRAAECAPESCSAAAVAVTLGEWSYDPNQRPRVVLRTPPDRRHRRCHATAPPRPARRRYAEDRLRSRPVRCESRAV